jgi:hypothetical protein
MKTIVVVVVWLLAASGISRAQGFSSAGKFGDANWIQVGEGEFTKFMEWGRIARIDLEGEDRAICNVVDYSGGPFLKPVLTIESREAVAALKKRLRSEGNWYGVRFGKEKKEGFVRWGFVHHAKLVRESADNVKGMAVVHITNGQKLELGTIVDAKAVEELMDGLKK